MTSEQGHDLAVHPLLDHLLAAAAGQFPLVDGRVTYLPGLPGGMSAVVALTGHAFVAASLTAATRADLEALEPDGFGGSLAPAFLLRLAAGGRIGVVDATLCATGRGGGALPVTAAFDDHPRVRLARVLRQDVVVHGDARGFVTLARGLAGRQEMSVEVIDADAQRGAGRQLIAEALQLAETAEPVFAAVSPGNARSLRAFLAQGFVPLGSEVIITRAAWVRE